MRILRTALAATSVLAILAESAAAQPGRIRAVHPRVGPAPVGAEMAVSPPSYERAPFAQGSSAAASDGTNYLVVWADERDGSRVNRIFASRVTPDGVVLDRAGIFLGEGVDPAVVWVETAWAVVWSAYGGGTALRLVDRDGAAGPPRLVSPDGSRAGEVAYNGGRLVFPFRRYPGNVLIAVLVDPHSEAPLVELPLIDDGSPYHGRIETAAAGSGFLFVTLREFDCPSIVCQSIVTQTLLPDGTVHAGGQIRPPARLGSISLVSAEGGFLILGTESRSGDVVAWQITRDGSPKGSLLLVDHRVSEPPRSRALVASNGSRILVAWDVRTLGKPTLVEVADLAPDGAVLQRRLIEPDTPETWLGHIAAGDGGFLLTWTEVTDVWQERDIVAVNVLSARFGGPAPALVSRSARMQEWPSVAAATASDTHLFAWREAVDGLRRTEVAVARVAGDGAALDPYGIPCSAPFVPGTEEGAEIAVASDGTSFVLAWVQERALYLRRIAADGTWIDPQPVRFASNSCSVSRQSLAWNGRAYAFVWSNCSSGVMMATIPAAGAIVPTEGALLQRGHAPARPLVLWKGDGYLIAWDDGYKLDEDCEGYCEQHEIGYLVLSAEGVPSGDAQRILMDGDTPRAAWNGSVFLLAWSTGLPVGVRLDRSGRRLDPEPEGALLSPIPPRDIGWIGDVVWNGSAFVLATAGGGFWGEENVRVTFLDPDRPLADQASASRLLVNRSANNSSIFPSFGPAVSLRPDGSLLVAYSRTADEPEYGGVRRVFVRRVPVVR